MFYSESDSQVCMLGIFFMIVVFWCFSSCNSNIGSKWRHYHVRFIDDLTKISRFYVFYVVLVVECTRQMFISLLVCVCFTAGMCLFHCWVCVYFAASMCLFHQHIIYIGHLCLLFKDDTLSCHCITSCPLRRNCPVNTVKCYFCFSRSFYEMYFSIVNMYSCCSLVCFSIIFMY